MSSALLSILELARWAPSGDNTQPWRFTVDDDKLVIKAHDTRESCVYDLDGHASQIAVGALLETLTIAATMHGLRAVCTRRRGTPDGELVYDVELRDDGVVRDALADFITERAVQRRPMATRAIHTDERQQLEASTSPEYRVRWFASPRAKAAVARLYWNAAHLRLTLPEAYRVHASVIDWGRKTSEDKIPSEALGARAPLLLVMRWALGSWARVDLMNRYLAGTILPRVELDLVPALLCGGHWVLVAHRAPESIDDYVSAGRAMQRFWLTATRLGLLCQPQYTPLVFARYAREGRTFSGQAQAAPAAARIARMLKGLVGETDAECAVFMGRIGSGPRPIARSLRKPLAELMLQ